MQVVFLTNITIFIILEILNIGLIKLSKTNKKCWQKHIKKNQNHNNYSNEIRKKEDITVKKNYEYQFLITMPQNTFAQTFLFQLLSGTFH